VQPKPGAGPAAPPVSRRAQTWWWFLVPLCTCGIGTFVMVLIGGVRLRAKAHLAAAALYFVLTVYFLVGVQYTPTNGGSLPDAAVMPAFLLTWLGGIAHVVYLQLRLSGAPPVTVPAPSTGVDPALAAAQWRVLRRQEARAILSSDSPLAAELRIGRPDLRRAYDDGGLVDVNHVPAAVLVAELDLTPEVAAGIVAQRQALGGFSSGEELVVYCQGMTPDRLSIIRDRLVFVPL
jgi:hypothetical protein